MHPNSDLQLERKEISPKDAQITKIQIWHSDYEIYGFKFYSNEKKVLEAGDDYYDFLKEVNLEAGERLVGVKSKLGDNSLGLDTLHCNLVLLIGKLE